MTPFLLNVLCAFFVVMAVPLIFQIVPPNYVYGFRTRRTLADKAVWYRANRFFGSGLVISSAMTLLAVAAAPPAVIHDFGILFLLLPIGVLLIVSALYQRTL